jgi:hypothetical protein
MKIIRTGLGLLAMGCFSLGAFEVRHDLRVNWIALGLAIFTLMYLLEREDS